MIGKFAGIFANIEDILTVIFYNDNLQANVFFLIII